MKFVVELHVACCDYLYSYCLDISSLLGLLFFSFAFLLHLTQDWWLSIKFLLKLGLRWDSIENLYVFVIETAFVFVKRYTILINFNES